MNHPPDRFFDEKDDYFGKQHDQSAKRCAVGKKATHRAHKGKNPNFSVIQFIK